MNTHDGGNGAARAAYRLHRGLREEGISSRMFVRTKETDDGSVDAFEMSLGLSLWERVRRWLRRERIQRAFSPYEETRPEQAELFYDDRTPYKGHILNQSPSADIYQLHTIYGFVDHRSFFHEVSRPVVWTLHDVNPFTGGCQYNVDCTRYRQSCGRCPQLGSETERDLSRHVWHRKRCASRPLIEEGRLQVVAPSTWMAREARRSSLFSEATIEVIPNGLDPEAFRPRDTEGVATALGIPPDHRIVLFLASSTEHPRKGFDLFSEAVEAIGESEVSFISVGGGEPELAEHLHHVHLGHVESDLLLSVFYSLADLFVIPSRQDNLPNTVLESMACGTPVVGTDTGGIPDMVRPGETGWLAETGNVRELRATIETALREKGKRTQMASRCRRVVEKKYTLERQAREYKALYHSLMHEDSGRVDGAGVRSKV